MCSCRSWLASWRIHPYRHGKTHRAAAIDSTTCGLLFELLFNLFSSHPGLDSEEDVESKFALSHVLLSAPRGTIQGTALRLMVFAFHSWSSIWSIVLSFVTQLFLPSPIGSRPCSFSVLNDIKSRSCTTTKIRNNHACILPRLHRCSFSSFSHLSFPFLPSISTPPPTPNRAACFHVPFLLVPPSWIFFFFHFPSFFLLSSLCSSHYRFPLLFFWREDDTRRQGFHVCSFYT